MHIYKCSPYQNLVLVTLIPGLDKAEGANYLRRHFKRQPLQNSKELLVLWISIYFHERENAQVVFLQTVKCTGLFLHRSLRRLCNLQLCHSFPRGLFGKHSACRPKSMHTFLCLTAIPNAKLVRYLNRIKTCSSTCTVEAAGSLLYAYSHTSYNYSVQVHLAFFGLNLFPLLS